MICGKVIYKTPRQAIDSIKGTAARKDYRISNVRNSQSYWCQDCQGYHVSSSESRKSIIVTHGQTSELNTMEQKNKKNGHWNERLIIHSHLKFKIK